MDDQLKFKKQIESAVNKVNSKLGMIRRSFEHLDGDMLLHLHNSIVRPNLEYCNSMWSTIYKKDIQLLEKPRSHGVAWGGKCHPCKNGYQLFATPGNLSKTFLLLLYHLTKERYT